MAKDNNSPFITGILAGGVGIGAGVAAHRFLPNTISTNQPVNPISNFFSQTSNVRAVDWNARNLERLVGRLSETNLSTEEIKQQLRASSMSVDPSGLAVQEFIERLDGGVPVKEVLEDLVVATKTSNSIYLQRTVSSFLENMDMLDYRLQNRMSIKTTALPPVSITRRITGEKANRYLQGRGEITEQLKRIQAMTGGRLEASIVRRRGPNTASGELQIAISGSEKLPKAFGKKPQLKLSIPLSHKDNPNIVYSGQSQQSKNIVGQFWYIDEPNIAEMFEVRRKMRYEEWAVDRLEKQLLPEILNQKSRSKIRSSLSTFKRSIREPFQWVYDIPKGINPILDEYIKVRSFSAHLFGAEGEKLSDIEYGEVLRRGIKNENIFPGFSPGQMAKNVVSRADVRKADVFGEVHPWVRRPAQWLRPDYYPTQNALRLMSNDPINQRFQWIGKISQAEAPLFKTTFIKGKDISRMNREWGFNPEGSGFISENVMGLFEHRVLKTYKVSSQDLLDLPEILGDMNRGEWTGQLQVPEGAVLGLDPLGKPVMPDKPFQILSAKRVVDKNLGDVISITGAAIEDNMKSIKTFGFKNELIAKPSNVIGQINKSVAVENGSQVILSVNDLRKNRAFHRRQMITALFEASYINNKKEMTKRARKRYRFHPESIPKFDLLTNLDPTIKSLTNVSDEEFIQKTWEISKRAKLTHKQLGSVYGAVPEVMGFDTEDPVAFAYDWKKRFGFEISERRAEAILQGTPIGVGQFFTGGHFSAAAGRQATIEPRMWEMLSGDNIYGGALKEEVLERMTAKYPHRLMEQEVMSRAVVSLLEPGAENLGVAPNLWTPEMTASGGTLAIPGIGSITVPPASDISQLASYKTASGETIRSDLGRAYENVIASASDLQAGKITSEQMRSELDNLIGQATRATIAGTITGEGSLGRGGLPGSRYLTALPTTAQQRASILPGEVGITRPMAQQMFSELEDVYGASPELEQMKTDLYSGKGVYGMSWRHPIVDPTSIQTGRVRLIPGEDPIAVVGEQIKRASYKGQEIGDIRLGIGAGMGLDYDADDIAVSMLSPKLQSQMSSSYNEAIDIRHQLLRARGGTSLMNLTEGEEMASAALRLRVPKERLGSVSETLQAARAGIVANQESLGRERTRNALSQLGLMERSLIESKHIGTGAEAGMIAAFENMRKAVESKNASRISSTLRDMVGGSGIASDLLGSESVPVEVGGREYQIPGIDINTASQDIASSLETFEKSGGRRMRQIIRGKGPLPSVSEARSILSNSASSSVLSELISPSVVHTPPTGKMASLAQRALTMANEAIKSPMGQTIRRYAKPVGIGLGAAIGAGILFSPPPKAIHAQIEPPQITPQRQRDHQVEAEQILGSNIVGSPSSPDPLDLARRTARVSTGNNITVRASIPRHIDYNNVNQQIAALTGSRNIQTRVLDQRRSLTPSQINRILEED